MQANQHKSTPQHIYPLGNRNYHFRMGLTNKEIRLKNFLSLVEPRGAAAELAKDLEVESNYLSRIRTGKKNIGDDMARKIEVVRNLSEGWMDVQHDDIPPVLSGGGHVIVEASSPDDLATKLSALDRATIFEIVQRAMDLQDAKKKD
jgi:transcriptional regulator with XRE-family HTH domain